MMNTKKTLQLLAIGFILTPISTIAHPGHGSENPLSPGHYVTNSEHALPLLLLLSLGMVFTWFINRRANRVNEK